MVQRRDSGPVWRLTRPPWQQAQQHVSVIFILFLSISSIIQRAAQRMEREWVSKWVVEQWSTGKRCSIKSRVTHTVLLFDRISVSSYSFQITGSNISWLFNETLDLCLDLWFPRFTWHQSGDFLLPNNPIRSRIANLISSEVCTVCLDDWILFYVTRIKLLDPEPGHNLCNYHVITRINRL